jgi:hypothetical protein
MSKLAGFGSRLAALAACCLFAVSTGSRPAEGLEPLSAAEITGHSAVTKVFLPLCLRGGDSSPWVHISFNAFPDGTPITEDVILRGDEFAAQGVLFAGAPETSYCSGATATAIDVLPPNHCCTHAPYLTSVAPEGPMAFCDAVPVEITFVEPVREVRIVFEGASVVYTMTLYDSSDRLLARVGQSSTFCGGQREVSYRSPSARIRRLTFGRTYALTVVQEIHYRH